MCAKRLQISHHDEEARWRRTRDIVLRIQPGPYEDPNYLTRMARQAASVEYILSKSDRPTNIPPDVFSAF
jgi:hypothetical protein